MLLNGIVKINPTECILSKAVVIMFIDYIVHVHISLFTADTLGQNTEKVHDARYIRKIDKEVN